MVRGAHNTELNRTINLLLNAARMPENQLSCECKNKHTVLTTEFN